MGKFLFLDENSTYFVVRFRWLMIILPYFSWFCFHPIWKPVSLGIIIPKLSEHVESWSHKPIADTKLVSGIFVISWLDKNHVSSAARSHFGSLHPNSLAPKNSSRSNIWATTRHPALLAKKGKQNRDRRSCSGTSATLSVSILLPSAISSEMLRAPWQCGTSSFSTGDPATSMASSSVSQSPMCHCLVLEIIQFLGTVETPCLQDPSDTSPLFISPLFEFAKLTDTAEVVACCAAFLSSSLEASSEDIKGRKTSMISSWLAVWTAITS